MTLRRFLSVSSVVVIATGAALAQPKKDDKAKAPATPAAGSAAPAGSATPAAADGSAVAPIEDAPPSDMEGRDENPDSPRGAETNVSVTTAPVVEKPTGYPIELSQRPITLPKNMAEVSISPHFQASPYAGTDALRARYGITPKIQLGLTYVMGGIYDEPSTPTDKDYKFHPGKAGGLDVTVLLKNWVGIKVGLPMYLDPFAMGLSIGAPMKFHIGDKLAIGILDDVLNIALPIEAKFAPSFYQELYNARAADRYDNSMSTQSSGTLRISGYAQYQQKANMAVIGDLAIEFEDFSTNRGDTGYGGATTSIHGGILFSPKKFLDVGGTLGFDDLSQMPDSFAVRGILAVRI